MLSLSWPPRHGCWSRRMAPVIPARLQERAPVPRSHLLSKLYKASLADLCAVIHACGSSAVSCGQTALFHAPLDSTSPVLAKGNLCSSRSHPAAWMSWVSAWASTLGPVPLLHFISLSDNTRAFCFSKRRVKFRLLKNGQNSLLSVACQAVKEGSGLWELHLSITEPRESAHSFPLI